MADVRRYPFLRHLRSRPTEHVIHRRRGQVVHSGRGVAFWFRPLSAALSEVPVDDRELPLLFHARTEDHQDVTVQATVAYRFADPDLAAQRLDFSLHPDTGRPMATPLEQVAAMLTELGQQHALDVIAGLGVPRAIAEGIGLVRERVREGLAGEQRLRGTGLEVVDVRVVAIRAEPDLEKALQTPTREQVQSDADRARFERRALAVERERAISENELQSQIELARREEDLVRQRGANDRLRATETAAAGQIEAEAGAGRDRLTAVTRAEAARLIGEAEGAAEEARLAAYRELDVRILHALALRELAGQLPEVGSLTITPDVLTGLLDRLTR
jgi:regulator of protease activity HflC (stomatin/prohibitin superfamily)